MDVKRFRDRTFPVYRDIVDGNGITTPESHFDIMVFQKGVPKILISNVMQYFADHFRDMMESSKSLDFPNLAPPFNICWFEGQVPKNGDIFVDMPTGIGVTYMAFDIKNPDPDGSRPEPGLTEDEKKIFRLDDDALDNVRWITHLVGALKPPFGSQTWAPIYHMTALVNEDGSCPRTTVPKPQGDGFEAAHVMQSFGLFAKDYPDDRLTFGLSKLDLNILLLFSIVPVLMSVTFLHCKNVELVEKTTLFHTDNRAKTGRIKKKSKVAKVRYHMLTVEPVKKILATQGRIDEVGGQKALHICRGHFKDYREHGLFGKYKGIYWWNQQLRGDKSQGIMVKDYKELAPR